MITSIDQLDLSKKYTYADYLNWQLDEMVELIEGKVIRMDAPSTSHQLVSGNLHGVIWSYLRDKPFKLFAAPFDVRLPLPQNQQQNDRIETVVQPDLCVICDPSKIDDRGCNGAPDWIIEILAKSTARKDLTDKFNLYNKAGVQEYWAVHPEEGTLLIYQLDDNNCFQLLRLNPFTRQESVPVGVLPGLTLDLRGVFE